MYNIVYKCPRGDACHYPDIIIEDPVDDHCSCPCGDEKRGHHTFKEDMVKKALFEKRTAETYLGHHWNVQGRE